MPGGLYPPVEVMASWPTPNYINPETRGDGTMIVAITFSAMGILIITARLYSRIMLTRAIGWDDALAVLALFFSISLAGLIIYAQKSWGLGRHVWDLPIPWITPFRIVTWASEWCYILSSSCIKISVLLFYKRLSSPFPRSFLIATYIGIAYNLAYFVAFGLVLVLLCHPLDAYWNQWNAKWLLEGHQYHCANEAISLPASAAFSVVGDIYTTLVPLILVYNMYLPKEQKRALYGLFTLGFFVVVAGIIRTYYLGFLMNGTYDVPWYLYYMWIWALLELNISILVGSGPALRPLIFRYVVEPVRYHFTAYDYGSYGYGSARGGTNANEIGASARHQRIRNSSSFSDVKKITHASTTETTVSTSHLSNRDSIGLRTQSFEMASRKTPEDGTRKDIRTHGRSASQLHSTPLDEINESEVTIYPEPTYQRHPGVSGMAASPRDLPRSNSLSARVADRAFQRDQQSMRRSHGREPPPVLTRLDLEDSD